MIPMNTTITRHPKLHPVIDCDVMDEAALSEYREVADAVGLEPAYLLIEEFRLFLSKHDIPTFRLGEVIRYVDDLTARDNPSKLGWQWCPVRPRDAAMELDFGTPSIAEAGGLGGTAPDQFRKALFQQMAKQQSALNASPARPASDYYSHQSAKLYERPIPLHALKKVALIEREFGVGKVAFLVTDYVTQPHIAVNPDPFLMAVIPNAAIGQGKGRFVIDVWDEPGFGVAHMVR